MSLGSFILDQRLNFSRSWTILRIQLKVYGNVHVLQNASTFGILSFLWLGVSQNIRGPSMVQNLHSGLSFGLCEGKEKSWARPNPKQFVRCVVSRWLSNAGNHKSKLRSIKLQLLTHSFRIKRFLLIVLMSPLVGINLNQ